MIDYMPSLPISSWYRGGARRLAGMQRATATSYRDRLRLVATTGLKALTSVIDAQSETERHTHTEIERERA